MARESAGRVFAAAAGEKGGNGLSAETDDSPRVEWIVGVGMIADEFHGRPLNQHVLVSCDENCA